MVTVIHTEGQDCPIPMDVEDIEAILLPEQAVVVF